MKELNIITKDNLVEKLADSEFTKDEASLIIKEYGFPMKEVGELINEAKEIKVSDVEQKADMIKAKDIRLKLVKVRTGLDSKRKEMKAEYIKKGNGIQAVYNYAESILKETESYLKAQEDFEKNLLEAKRQEMIAKRELELEKFKEHHDTSIYRLDVEEEAWKHTISMLELAEEKRLKEEKEAEEKRLAEENAEAERIKKIENRNHRVAELNELGFVIVGGKIKHSKYDIKELDENIVDEYTSDDFELFIEECVVVVEKKLKEFEAEQAKIAEENAKAEAERKRIEEENAKKQKELAEKQAELDRIEQERIQEEKRKADEKAKAELEIKRLASASDKEKFQNWLTGVMKVMKETRPKLNNVDISTLEVKTYDEFRNVANNAWNASNEA